MKSLFILFFCGVTSVQLMGQSFLPSIFYNGIDTFFIGDKKTKYINANNNKIFKHVQTDTLKGQVISRYAYNKDSLVAFIIDTITFRNMILTFNDSNLSEISFFKNYRVKDYGNAVDYVESKMKYLRKYISDGLHKKGKSKKFITTNTYRYYGYEWKKGDYVINLTIQFEVPKSRFISMDVYIANRKLANYY